MKLIEFCFTSSEKTKQQGNDEQHAAKALKVINVTPPMSPISSSRTLAPEPLHSSISRQYHHHRHCCFPIGANAPWSCGGVPLPSHFRSRRSSGSMNCCCCYRRSCSSRGVSRRPLQLSPQNLYAPPSMPLAYSFPVRALVE
jgi:hypothetical protein